MKNKNKWRGKHELNYLFIYVNMCAVLCESDSTCSFCFASFQFVHSMRIYLKRFKSEEEMPSIFGSRTHTFHLEHVCPTCCCYLWNEGIISIAKCHYMCVLCHCYFLLLLVAFLRTVNWPFDCLFVWFVVYLNFICAFISQTTEILSIKWCESVWKMRTKWQDLPRI